MWIVDPLDGTVNYANGLPVFCVSIALVVDGVPTVGVIVDPTRGEAFAATVDGPAFLADRPVRASAKEKLSDFVISMSLNGRTATSRARNVRKAIRISRSMGSAALALAYVANGRFDAFIQQGGLSAWDVAAAGLIAERGGATVTSMTGGPWFDLGHSPKSIGIVAAPPGHHATLLEPGPLGRLSLSSSQRWGLDRSRSRPHSSQNASHSARGAPSQRSSSGSVWRIGTPSATDRSRARSR